MFADNTSVFIDTQEFPETSFDGQFENGIWAHGLDSVIYSKGNWDKGLKTGIWEYNTGESQFAIDFKTYKHAVTDFQVSYPDNWKIYDKIDPSSVFSASDTSEVGDRRTKLFIVLAHDKKAIGKTLSEFNDYYNEAISTDSVIAKQTVRVVGASRQYYLNIFVIKKYGEELLAFNLLGESPDIIYDISYKTKNERSEEKLLKFLEMSLTARLGQLRLLDPLDKMKRIERVESKLQRPTQAISHASTSDI